MSPDVQVVNESLVNPFINYPFVPDTVTLIENYTSLAHQLGLSVKYYYTNRELSNHAAELYALRYSPEGDRRVTTGLFGATRSTCITFQYIICIVVAMVALHTYGFIYTYIHTRVYPLCKLGQ